MNKEVSEEISRLETQATIREQKADEKVAEAPLCLSVGSAMCYEALARADHHRKKARKLRDRAAQLRRYNV